MKLQSHENVEAAMGMPPALNTDLQEPTTDNGHVASRQTLRKISLGRNFAECSERWGRLLVMARNGDRPAYERLLRELDDWLRRYYARRLPHPAADDARQEALLAIHAKQHTYDACKPFGAWLTAIARYKYFDRLRDASRYAAMSLDEEEMPIEDHGRAAVSAAALDTLLRRLKPSQASVIRLVKLNGLSIARASGATGQSASLVKINIHRGMKKLAALIS